MHSEAKTTTKLLGKKIQKTKKAYLCSVKDCGKIFDNHFGLKRHFTKLHKYNHQVQSSEFVSSDNPSHNVSDQNNILFSINPGSSLSVEEIVEGIEIDIELEDEDMEEEEIVIYKEEDDLLLNF